MMLTELSFTAIAICFPPLAVLLLQRRTHQAAAIVVFCMAFPVMHEIGGTFISTVQTAELAFLGLVAVTGVSFRRKRDPADRWIGLFLFACAVSWTWADDQTLAFKGLVKMLSFLAAYLIGRISGRGPGTVESLLRTLTRAAMLLCVVIIGGAFVTLISNHFSYQEFAHLRYELWSPFLNANPTACFLGVILPLAIAIPRATWVPPWMGMALIALVLLVTNSRSGLLGASAAVTVLIAVTARRRVRRYAVPGMILVTVLATAYSLNIVRTVSFGDRDYNRDSRLYYWQVAVEVVKSNPLLGIGLGNYITVDPASRVSGDTMIGAVVDTLPHEHAHNLYLTTAAELGIPGALVLCAVFAATLLRCYRFHALTGDTTAAALGAALLGFLTAGIFEYHLTASSGSLPFFLCGLAAAATSASKNTMKAIACRSFAPVRDFPIEVTSVQ